jgi:hypothetical protein
MKKIVVSTAFAGLALGLSGCGGSVVDGKWCPEGNAGHVVFSGDKLTITDGTRTMTGKFKIEGKTLTATPDDPTLAGSSNTLTISDDGKTLSSGSEPYSVKFTRCS